MILAAFDADYYADLRASAALSRRHSRRLPYIIAVAAAAGALPRHATRVFIDAAICHDEARWRHYAAAARLFYSRLCLLCRRLIDFLIRGC